MKSKTSIWILTISLAAVLLVAGCGSGTTQTGANRQAGSRPGMANPGGHGDPAPPSSGPVISVKAQKAIRGNVANFIQTSTTLDATRSVDVFSKATGIAVNVDFEEGDQVRADQLLVKLDDKEIQNQYNQSKLAVDQAEIALKQAKVRKEQSASDFKRNSDLLKEKLVSQQEYDKSKLDDEYAQLTLENATNDLKVAREKFDASKIQLENTEIRSPISGIITERVIETGDMVKTNDKVCAIADMSLLLARVYVPETDLHRIQVGQAARVESEALPGVAFQGKVSLISPVINADTGTGKVTIEISDSSRRLKPGMFVNAYLTTSLHENVIKVLRKAVWHQNEEDWLFVVKKDDTVEKRKVTLGYTENDWVEIQSGLNAGETVVTVGQDSLDNGFGVKIAEYEGETREQRMARDQQEQPAPASNPRMQMMQLMQNPAVQQEIEAARKSDPGMFRDPEKRREFFRKLQEKYGKK